MTDNFGKPGVLLVDRALLGPAHDELQKMIDEMSQSGAAVVEGDRIQQALEAHAQAVSTDGLIEFRQTIMSSVQSGVRDAAGIADDLNRLVYAGNAAADQIEDIDRRLAESFSNM